MEDQNINNPPVNNTPSDHDDAPAEPTGNQPDSAGADASYGQRMQDRLERLGGEPAPVITPDEFARLQKAGQVHIDARGRVQTARRSDDDAGVSLRKRRAWYGK